MTDATTDRSNFPSLRGENGQFARTLKGAERDGEACRLRMRGLSYQQISDALNYGSKGHAHRGVGKALRDTQQESADALRELETQRLDALTVLAWEVIASNPPLVQMGKIVRDGMNNPVRDGALILAAIDCLTRISARRSRLHGLDLTPSPEISAVVRYELPGVDVAKLT